MIAYKACNSRISFSVREEHFFQRVVNDPLGTKSRSIEWNENQQNNNTLQLY